MRQRSRTSVQVRSLDLEGAGGARFDQSTFWREDEMRVMVGGQASASSMGHLPVGGPNGSLQVITPLPITHKIYTHINNTNPMLVEDSPEHALVKAAGAEVGWDGLELTL